ncbi:MAG: hypothetical protein WCJ57_01475 [Candidatus Falkowbacteria bacterium]
MTKEMGFITPEKTVETPLNEIQEEPGVADKQTPDCRIIVPIEEKKTRMSAKRKIEEENHREAVRNELTEMSWRNASGEQIMVRDRVREELEASGNKITYMGAIIDDRGQRYMHVGIDSKKGLTRVTLDKDDKVISLTEI